MLEQGPVIKNSSDLQLALRDVYETTYGIHDHTYETEEHALSLVAMREAEDGSSGGLLYERIRHFDEREVRKYFGYSLTEFLELPTDILTYILEVCTRRQEQSSRVANTVEEDVRRMTEGE